MEFENKMIIEKIPVKADGSIWYKTTWKKQPGVYPVYLVQLINGRRTTVPVLLKYPFTDKPRENLLIKTQPVRVN
jgi:hypothetical protein